MDIARLVTRYRAVLAASAGLLQSDESGEARATLQEFLAGDELSALSFSGPHVLSLEESDFRPLARRIIANVVRPLLDALLAASARIAPYGTV